MSSVPGTGNTINVGNFIIHEPTPDGDEVFVETLDGDSGTFSVADLAEVISSFFYENY